jgi:GNAT superfamily N-acetyltransferase
MITIRQATIQDLEQLVPLFDGYRQFYGQPSDVVAAEAFLHDRFVHSESVIHIASRNALAVGFSQLFPSFSSISMCRIYVLNDLFVARDARKLGVGHLLLEAAVQYGRSMGARQLTLETAKTNVAAQHLYETDGWERDTEFYVYQITLDPRES